MAQAQQVADVLDDLAGAMAAVQASFSQGMSQIIPQGYSHAQGGLMTSPPPVPPGWQSWAMGPVQGCDCPACEARRAGLYPGQVPQVTTYGAPSYPVIWGRQAEGFDGNSVEDLPEPDFAAGTVTGYRWWTVPQPDFNANPLRAGSLWPVRPLRGQVADWAPGINTASCEPGFGSPHPGNPVPYSKCGCGFYGYWDPRYYNLGRSTSRVLEISGVVEGWGRTLIGDLGFRCEKVRVLALAADISDFAAYKAGWISVGGEYAPAEIPPEDRARLETWAAVISVRLGQLHPRARIFGTRKAMQAAFPPDELYARKRPPLP